MEVFKKKKYVSHFLSKPSCSYKMKAVVNLTLSATSKFLLMLLFLTHKRHSVTHHSLAIHNVQLQVLFIIMSLINSSSQ